MKLPDFPKPPPSLDPTLTYGENLIEADCESLNGSPLPVAQAHRGQ